MNKGELMNFHPTPWLKHWLVLCLLFLSTMVFSTTAFSASLDEEAQEFVLSEAELAQTLAPIALYPDTLLTHILIASTYPIEVIEAERWLSKNSALTSAQVARKAQQKDWDASIQALLAFPQVMTKLSEDLSWMQKLGDAFLQDEARVLASIQTLRQQAEQAGSLANMDNVKVIKEQKIIIIEPAQPEIIYVPYYDTRVVYGRWHWSHYPPVYWQFPNYYAAYYGPFYWGYGVHISTNFFFSAFHWHNRHVVVNHYNRHGYHPRKKIVTSHQAKRWNHQPKHRRGVAYSNGRLKQKYYGARPSVRSTNTYKSNVYNRKIHKNKAIHHNKAVQSTSVQRNKQSKQHNKRVVVKSNHKAKQHTATKYQGKHQVKSQQRKVQDNSRKTKAYVAKKKVKQNVHQSSKKSYSPSKQVSHQQVKHQQVKHRQVKSQQVKRNQPTRKSSRHSATSTRHQQSKQRIK